MAEVAEKMSEAAITRTALVLIGPMLDESPCDESHLYDKRFSHLFRKSREPGSAENGRGIEEPQRVED